MFLRSSIENIIIILKFGLIIPTHKMVSLSERHFRLKNPQWKTWRHFLTYKMADKCSDWLSYWVCKTFTRQKATAAFRTFANAAKNSNEIQHMQAPLISYNPVGCSQFRKELYCSIWILNYNTAPTLTTAEFVRQLPPQIAHHIQSEFMKYFHTLNLPEKYARPYSVCAKNTIKPHNKIYLQFNHYSTKRNKDCMVNYVICIQHTTRAWPSTSAVYYRQLLGLRS